MTLTITPYDNAAHRAQVIDLWTQIFAYDAPHNRPAVAIDKKLQVADQLFFVAVSTGAAVVGTVMAGYDGHRGWIYSVAVHPDHRQRGIGSRLMSHAERALTGRGCMKINLIVLDDNQAVMPFYESLGYAVEKRIFMGKRIPENIPPA